MAKGEELVKYVTEQVVKYIDTPKEVRKQHRMNRKVAKEPWPVRWFGMIPLALSISLARLRKRKR